MATTSPTASTPTPSISKAYTSRPCGSGEFCWYECVSRNKAAATSFYGRLIDATAEVCPQSPIPYTILSCEGRAALGLYEMDAKWPKDATAQWMGYIAVENLDAACAKVPKLGGKVTVPPTDISIGRFSVITDPTGAVVSLFQGASGKTDGVNWSGPGLVGWNELMSTEPKRAVEFYTALLGWQAAEKTEFGFPYWMFSCNSRVVAGLMAKCPDDKSPRSYWLQYVQTKDLNASMKRATTLGGTACCEAMEIPGIGRTAFFTDPNGACFALWEPALAGSAKDSGTSNCGCGGD